MILVIRGWGIYIAKILADYKIKFLKEIIFPPVIIDITCRNSL